VGGSTGSSPATRGSSCSGSPRQSTAARAYTPSGPIPAGACGGSSIELNEIVAGLRLVAGLPSFLRHPVSPEQARLTLQRRLARRADDFLALARAAIYARSGSPYRRLLELAGCEYGDLERLVRDEGLEGALGALYRRGVYLTVDEFTGRVAAVRGSATIRVEPRRLGRPGPVSGWVVPTSGSRGPAREVSLDLAHLRDRAMTAVLLIGARGGRRWSHAIWGTAGGWGAVRVLECSALGAPPVRWFSPLDPSERGIPPRYRWATRALLLAGLLSGVPLPRPEVVPLDRPEPVARWMVEVARAGGTPHLIATPSAVVGVARAALAAGLSLQGGQFTMPGEPTTAARRAIIHESGAQAMVSYISQESGPIGYGCLAASHPDEVHLLEDLLACVQSADGPLSPLALLFTSLRPAAPLLMLNVSLGDQAEVVRRSCGCPLERLGWATRLHTIRSFEKLTAEGATFLDLDVIRVLEQALPRRFGGAPTDYQLVEESEGPEPIIRLLVHPAVGELEAGAVAAAFLDELGAGSPSGAIWARLWRQAGLPRVERRAPHVTASGKIHHLHAEPSGGAPHRR
jgi:hypothetical protein